MCAEASILVDMSRVVRGDDRQKTRHPELDSGSSISTPKRAYFEEENKTIHPPRLRHPSRGEEYNLSIQ